METEFGGLGIVLGGLCPIIMVKYVLMLRPQEAS